MPYVLRDASGVIQAASVGAMDAPGWQFIEGHAAEYQDFLAAAMKEHDPFRESDIQLARVLEDLITLLIERDLIHFTDFPAAAQKRLIERQSLRMSGKRLNLIGDSEDKLF